MFRDASGAGRTRLRCGAAVDMWEIDMVSYKTVTFNNKITWNHVRYLGLRLTQNTAKKKWPEWTHTGVYMYFKNTFIFEVDILQTQ